MRNFSIVAVVLVLAAVLISGIYGYVDAYAKASAVHEVCLALQDRGEFTEDQIEQLSEDAYFSKVPTLQQACEEYNRADNYCAHKRTVLALEVCLCLIIGGLSVFMLRKEED